MQCNVANVHKINTSFLLYLALPDIHCYIHSVSPVKKSGGSNFINCDIQTPSAVVRGVCFAVDKKQTLDALAHQKSHTKISNYSISTKYGSKDIVMNKQTILTPLTTATFEQCQFNCHLVASSSRTTRYNQGESNTIVSNKNCHFANSPSQKATMLSDWSIKVDEAHPLGQPHWYHRTKSNICLQQHSRQSNKRREVPKHPEEWTAMHHHRSCTICRNPSRGRCCLFHNWNNSTDFGGDKCDKESVLLFVLQKDCHEGEVGILRKL